VTTGREELAGFSFRFVFETICDFDRCIVGALLILRDRFDLFVKRLFERLSSFDDISSRLKSTRVLLLRMGSSQVRTISVRSSCVSKVPFNKSL